MEKKKFYNETFEVNLMVIIYDQSSKKESLKLEKYLIKKGMDKSDAYDVITTASAFCHTFKNFILVCFDLNEFKENKTEALLNIAHECGHFRGRVLTRISEKITVTDSEVYSRISDWAFRKCMTMKYFKGLLK